MNWLQATSRWHPISIASLAIAFVIAGANHFVMPERYLEIMPSYLPYPLTLVYVSGFLEMLGGASLIIPRLRRTAGWGLIALLVAVFPANVEMLIRANDFPAIPLWALWLRLPMQGLLITWVWTSTIHFSTSVEA